MTEFLINFKSQIIYVLVVIFSWLVLRKLTNVLYKWLYKKEHLKFPGEASTTFNTIRRILHTLWFVLAILAIGFVFVDSDRYDILTSNFRLVLYLGLLAVGTIVLATTINIWFKKEIAKRIDNDFDSTNFKFLKSLVYYSIYILGLLFGLMAFPSMRGIANTALGGAGVLALVIGIASQEALANLVGGVFIILFKPFKVGDIVKVTDTMIGTVYDITLRHTVIRNFENKMIVIPNSIINKEKLINFDLGELKCCERIEVGISYDSDVELAKKIIQEECENHPLILDNRDEEDKAKGLPIVRVALIQLGDSSVIIRGWAWAATFGDSFNLRCDVLTSIKARFDAAGIEIPFPHRTVFIKNSKPNIKRDQDLQI